MKTFILALVCCLFFASSAFAAVSLAYPQKAGLGEPFLVRITSDTNLDSVSAKWLGATVQPEIKNWKGKSVALVMFGTDVLNDKAGKKTLAISVVENGKERIFKRKIKIYNKKYKVQRLTLPEKMVTPPKEVLERIRHDRVEVKAAKETQSAKRMWFVPFQKPTKGSQSSPYGARRILNGKPKNPHRGLDFRGAKGTAVHAMADGKVILVSSHYYAGNSIYIDHGNGVVTMYFHLSRFGVKEGDMVVRGQTIGRIGSTGRVTGPHLHVSVSVQGRLVDPNFLLKKNTDKLLGL
ncbi:M23 family metallopeptidase [Desulfovibrio sp. UCD-KL4C]|uniref:M23 family metallopeptidase n=1 Tax=Desulfovibrio sp. UCD-KL4C TaxID=2578120 RepID=UPI0025C42A8F|nr:M23 family metallopeptidase [Desulfovibrio sp. UCD-KL4C]